MEIVVSYKCHQEFRNTIQMSITQEKLEAAEEPEAEEPEAEEPDAEEPEAEEPEAEEPEPEADEPEAVSITKPGNDKNVIDKLPSVISFHHHLIALLKYLQKFPKLKNVSKTYYKTYRQKVKDISRMAFVRNTFDCLTVYASQLTEYDISIFDSESGVFALPDFDFRVVYNMLYSVPREELAQWYDGVVCHADILHVVFDHLQTLLITASKTVDMFTGLKRDSIERMLETMAQNIHLSNTIDEKAEERMKAEASDFDLPKMLDKLREIFGKDSSFVTLINDLLSVDMHDDLKDMSTENFMELLVDEEAMKNTLGPLIKKVVARIQLKVKTGEISLPKLRKELTEVAKNTGLPDFDRIATQEDLKGLGSKLFSGLDVPVELQEAMKGMLNVDGIQSAMKSQDKDEILEELKCNLCPDESIKDVLERKLGPIPVSEASPVSKIKALKRKKRKNKKR